LLTCAINDGELPAINATRRVVVNPVLLSMLLTLQHRMLTQVLFLPTRITKLDARLECGGHMNRQCSFRLSLTALLTAMSTALLAHHSVAAFDRTNSVVVAGTVKSYKLSNPHAWITLMVPNETGGEDAWALEGTAGAGLLRAGYTKYTLKVGEKVRILIAPRRDGTPGGEFTRILAVNGAPMKNNRQENE
jgi:hypothetical protein